MIVVIGDGDDWWYLIASDGGHGTLSATSNAAPRVAKKSTNLYRNFHQEEDEDYICKFII